MLSHRGWSREYSKREPEGFSAMLERRRRFNLTFPC